MKKRELRLPTIIGLVVVLAGLGAGLFVLRNPLRLSLSASGEETPSQVSISNVSDSTFAVSWVTSKAVTGFVQYGESGKEPDLAVSDDRDQEKGDVGSYYTHYVTVSGLKGGTKYSFKIGNKGEQFETTTGATLENTPTADVAYGLVMSEDGNPADGAIVYVQVPGGEPASALTKPSGAWVIPLATIRAAGLAGYVTYDKEQTEIEISVQGGNLGTSLVTVKTGEDSPVPTIALGKSYDFAADETVVEQDQSTESGDLASKFTGEALAPGTNPEETLEILTPKSDEMINTQRPQIIGRAPAGTEVSVEIHSSQVITGKTTTGEDGTFSFSVPTGLAPGEHTVTISATINGVVRQITKSFTVYAQGESSLPAFEATPSATLIPTLVPSATPTLLPTMTAQPTVIPTVTIQPTVAPTATPEPPTELPASGNVWPTILILVFGLGLLASGGVLLVQ